MRDKRGDSGADRHVDSGAGLLKVAWCVYGFDMSKSLSCWVICTLFLLDITQVFRVSSVIRWNVLPRCKSEITFILLDFSTI